jgi:hypothetical protein
MRKTKPDPTNDNPTRDQAQLVFSAPTANQCDSSTNQNRWDQESANADEPTECGRDATTNRTSNVEINAKYEEEPNADQANTAEV